MGSADDRSASIWAVASVFVVLTWISIGLRLYVRSRKTRNLGPDDKIVVAAQLAFTAYLICQFSTVAFGAGRKLSDLTRSNAETALKFWFVCEAWYAIAAALVKISICLSLRRVAVRHSHLLIIYGLVIWSAVLGVAFFLGILLQCIPASDWWSLDPAKKQCLQPHIVESLTYAISAVNVACDWTLGIFPYFIVKDLALQPLQKMLVIAIMAFGCLGSTATCIRMAYIGTLSQTYEGWNGEFLYDTVPIAVWSTVECGVAITASCLATLRPLVRQFYHSSALSNPYSSHRDEFGSPRTSHCRASPIPFDGYGSTRAQAEAIVAAPDSPSPILPHRHGSVSFSLCDSSKRPQSQSVFDPEDKTASLVEQV